MHNSNKSKIEFISKKGNLVINSNYFFLFIILFLLAFTIINFILFSQGMEINFPWGENNNININSINKWLGWLEMSIAGVGSMLTMSGVILVIRMNKNFIYPTIIGETLVVIDAIIVGAVFTGISYLLMIGASIYHWINWEKNKGEERFLNKYKFIYIFLFLVIYITSGLFISLSFNNLGNSLLDVVGSAFVVVGWYLILNKNKYGFIIFLITDISYMFYFFSSGIWSTGSSYIIYVFIDSISFISWLNLNVMYNENNKYD